MKDRRITIREATDGVGISIGLCHEIFSNVLGMKRVAAEFVPKLLNFEQKQRRMEVAQESLTIRQTWLRVTFSYFKNKENLKGQSFYGHRWH